MTAQTIFALSVRPELRFELPFQRKIVEGLVVFMYYNNAEKAFIRLNVGIL